MLGVGSVGLEPALGEVAGVLMCRVAGAFGGDEAGDDDGVAVEDAEVGFAFGEITVGTLSDGMEDGSVMLIFKECPIGAQERGRRGSGVGEGRGIGEGGDTAPLALLGHEDGAHKVLVELYGKDRIKFRRVAEGNEVKTDGVRKGNMTSDEVLARNGDIGERAGSHAVIRGLEFDGKSLRRGDSRVGGGELDRTEPHIDGIDDGNLRYDNLLRRRCGRRRGANVVTLGRGCAH